MTYSVFDKQNVEILFDEGITSEMEDIEVDAYEIHRGHRGELAIEYFSFCETSEYKKLQDHLERFFYLLMNQHHFHLSESEEDYLNMIHSDIGECSDLFEVRAEKYLRRLDIESEPLKIFLLRRYNFEHFLNAMWNSHPFKKYIEKCVEDEKWCDYSTFLLACETGLFPYPKGQDEHMNLANQYNWLHDKDMFAHLAAINKQAKSKEHPLVRVYRGMDTDEFLSASLLEVFRHEHIIKKCPNCGKYFIPYKRKSTIYCNRLSPQSPTRTCRQYAGSISNYKKLTEDAAKRKENNVRQALKMRASRNKDIPYLQNAVRVFNDNVDEWREAMEYGRKTEDEYLDWLESLKNTKYDEIFTQSQEELNE